MTSLYFYAPVRDSDFRCHDPRSTKFLTIAGQYFKGMFGGSFYELETAFRNAYNDWLSRSGKYYCPHSDMLYTIVAPTNFHDAVGLPKDACDRILENPSNILKEFDTAMRVENLV